MDQPQLCQLILAAICDLLVVGMSYQFGLGKENVSLICLGFPVFSDLIFLFFVVPLFSFSKRAPRMSEVTHRIESVHFHAAYLVPPEYHHVPGNMPLQTL